MRHPRAFGDGAVADVLGIAGGIPLVCSTGHDRRSSTAGGRAVAEDGMTAVDGPHCSPKMLGFRCLGAAMVAASTISPPMAR